MTSLKTIGVWCARTQTYGHTDTREDVYLKQVSDVVAELVSYCPLMPTVCVRSQVNKKKFKKQIFSVIKLTLLEKWRNIIYQAGVTKAIPGMTKNIKNKALFIIYEALAQSQKYEALSENLIH